LNNGIPAFAGMTSLLHFLSNKKRGTWGNRVELVFCFDLLLYLRKPASLVAHFATMIKFNQRLSPPSTGFFKRHRMRNQIVQKNQKDAYEKLFLPHAFLFAHIHGRYRGIFWTQKIEKKKQNPVYGPSGAARVTSLF
jgi:hypothetical protein